MIRPAASRRNEPQPVVGLGHWDILGAVAEFVQEFDDSTPDQLKLDIGCWNVGDTSEAAATYNFNYVIIRICNFLGHSVRVVPNAPSRSSPRPNVDLGENAQALASSSV